MQPILSSRPLRNTLLSVLLGLGTLSASASLVACSGDDTNPPPPPVADASTWTSGNGQVVIEYSEASTRLRARFTETRHGFTVSATLTAGGYALAGQDITFVTDPYGGSHVTLCTAATNSRGIASCHLTGSQERAFKRAWGAFTARYAGDPPDYKGSSARDHGVFS